MMLPSHVRFTWDYALLLDWAVGYVDPPDADLPAVLDVLPAPISERIVAWAAEMDATYGDLHLDQPTRISAEVDSRLEAEHDALCRELHRLGIEVTPENGNWPFRLYRS